MVISGTLTANGQLIANGTLTANGTLNAGTLNASTLFTTGDTITQGDLSVYKGIDLGRAVSSSAWSAMQIDYFNTRTASFDLTDSSGNFRWQDNIFSGTPRMKMLLDASNVLTLFNTTGSAAVTITPATGKIDLMGANGAGIYSNNAPVIAVGAAGATSVTPSSLTVTGATTTATLNVSGATTVNTLNASGAATLTSLTVSGATVLNGQVVLAAQQGDINMGIYGN